MLRQLSQKLMLEFEKAYETEPQISNGPILFIELNSLLHWLDDNSTYLKKNPEKITNEASFILLSLRTSLLHDLFVSLTGEKTEASSVLTKKESTKKRLAILVFGGLLAAACEGFDSTVTMLHLFSIPGWLMLAVALLSSFCSVIAFCGIELFKISTSLGIKFSEVHKLVDITLQQLNEIKLIRKKISAYKLAELSEDELRHLAAILFLLEQRHAQLIKLGEQVNQALNSTQVHIAHWALTSIASALFFGSGFCAGQTVALFIFGFMAAVTPVSVPVILFSVLVGLATLGLHWIELPGIGKIVNGWFGLDEERLDTLCDKEKQEREQVKLNALLANVHSCAQLKKHVPQLEKKIQETNFESGTLHVGGNPYSFMAPEIAANRDEQDQSNRCLKRSCSAVF